jgi:hypothetical protein
VNLQIHLGLLIINILRFCLYIRSIEMPKWTSVVIAIVVSCGVLGIGIIILVKVRSRWESPTEKENNKGSRTHVHAHTHTHQFG